MPDGGLLPLDPGAPEVEPSASRTGEDPLEPAQPAMIRAMDPTQMQNREVIAAMIASSTRGSRLTLGEHADSERGPS